MGTVWTRKGVDEEGQKWIVLESDTLSIRKAINESITIINERDADYGYISFWGNRLKIYKDSDTHSAHKEYCKLLSCKGLI